MARPCRTLSSRSLGGSPPEKKAGQNGALYVLLLALNVLLIVLFYFGIWRFFCKKNQRVDTNAATTSSSAPNSPNLYPRNGRLDSRVLSSLPIFVYSIGSEEKTECAVCLMEFKEGEEGRLLPRCNHGFHTECVDMWFQSHSTCPLCRASIESGASDSSAVV
ncbi:RING-H2 finger protein ATL64-like [Phoenix dactylifera]|uniref:RING-type E3 ubiquitin transferase n=1 Tax=Phoenix dactylifera TaxID=42345 RepID=A0A8B7C1W0_PHODC|nr:RING-H2 finger protein ATL64-like [Phoenix dactylifera]